eukprot:CAMPEP_0201511052 /NCGR_PEP_ID=MMETSP0161_2-20130828/3563_1 /ASSEMBLY_ACC=CAM_ASM_000251 /TAXON_ID=180227 /ORGANISM="Neoparamoeba aestuarina, Strain SoJaBio B1-5/56/2" /LENGTH=272 /DNA_ID=CAMNT_0047906383 /DNA_START=145 /DNA_END=963 /DNA_ORIENTATION=-
MAASNASTLSMARNVLKSASAALSSSRMPPVGASHVSQETLQTAREILQQSTETTVAVGRDYVPGIQLLQNVFKGSLTFVSFGVAKLHSLLYSAGEMGKKLLGIIQENPAKAVVVTGGVLLVVAYGVSKYKYYLVKVPEGQEQALLSQSSEIEAAPKEVESVASNEAAPVASKEVVYQENVMGEESNLFAGVEMQELNLMRCPITEAPFQDPVVAADGHTYERYAIEHWFRSGQRISPMTAQPLSHTELTPNFLVLETQEQLLGSLLPSVSA